MLDIYDYYFENYLMIYSLYGRGRPTVDRERFEALDRELVALLANSSMDGLSPEQASRVGEIEFLLLDDISEALMNDDYANRLSQSAEPEKPRTKVASHISGKFAPAADTSSTSSQGTQTPQVS